MTSIKHIHGANKPAQAGGVHMRPVQVIGVIRQDQNPAPANDKWGPAS